MPGLHPLEVPWKTKPVEGSRKCSVEPLWGPWQHNIPLEGPRKSHERQKVVPREALQTPGNPIGVPYESHREHTATPKPMEVPWKACGSTTTIKGAPCESHRLTLQTLERPMGDPCDYHKPMENEWTHGVRVSLNILTWASHEASKG